MTKWNKAERPKKQGGGHYPDARYREQASRKMDAVNMDRPFANTCWWQSKTVTVGIGWASEGQTAEEAADMLARLKQSRKTGGWSLHPGRNPGRGSSGPCGQGAGAKGAGAAGHQLSGIP
jgi:hypothetical protein